MDVSFSMESKDESYPFEIRSASKKKMPPTQVKNKDGSVAYKKGKNRLVKICGNLYPEDSMAVAAFEPDFMGWIFSPMSQRRISIPLSCELIAAIKAKHPAIRHVALFARNSPDEVVDIIQKVAGINFLQVIEGPDYIHDLRQRLSLNPLLPEFTSSIVPVLRVADFLGESDFAPYTNIPFYILDAYVKGKAGGTGQRIQLDYIKDVRHPYLLAGGLTHDNVADALSSCSALGADVSSGVEDGIPGRKNLKKVELFISAVRSEESQKDLC